MRNETRPELSWNWALLFSLISIYASPVALAQIEIRSPNAENGGDFGAQIIPITDVDGDGFVDILISAPHESVPGVSGAGRAYIASGRSGGVLRSLQSPAPFSGGKFGSGLALIRDFDSDGYRDILIGASGEDNGNGRAYVISTQTGAILNTLTGSGGFWSRMLDVGDVNGDGVADLVVSRSGGGGASLLSGQTLAVLRSWNLCAGSDWLGGGNALALIPDVNGDGRADLVMGGAKCEYSGSYIDEGMVAVYSLTSTAPISVFYSPHPNAYGRFGASVAELADQDGDGKGDLLVGAPNEGGVTPGELDDRGAAYVISFASHTVLRTLLGTEPSVTQSRNFGESSMVISDRNGDGTADWVIGAPSESTVYVVSGATGATIQVYKSGTQGSSGLGMSLARLAQASGDEIASGDLLNASLTTGGRVFVFLQDCNSNLIRDPVEVATGQATDCNNNGLPDSCDAGGYAADCNNNSIWDVCDILLGNSSDADNNQIPDECDIACRMPSACAGLAAGSDCNMNGIPDDCETAIKFLDCASSDSSGAPRAADDKGIALSADGRFVAFFSSDDGLVPGDSNGATDVFVKDLGTGAIENVHVASDGGQANASAFSGVALTPDGRFVSYVSAASNLVPNASGYQIYLFDRVTRQNKLASCNASNLQGDDYSVAPAISADGRFIAFWSVARNLAADDTNGVPDVFRKDLMTGEIRRVSVRSNGAQGNAASGARGTSSYFVASNQVTISSDGRYVAFASHATNLVPGDTNAARDVFVHDCELHETWRVSVSSAGAQANYHSAGYATSWAYGGGIGMSGDGRFVVFDSLASNLVPEDNNNIVDLFVYDRTFRTIGRISPPGTSSAPIVFNPLISNDGCRVMFVSNLSGVVAGQYNDDVFGLAVFSFDRAQNRYELVSRNGAGAQADGVAGDDCAITPDGYTVGFTSNGSNLIPGQSSGVALALVRSIAASSDCNGNHVPDSCECACSGDGNSDGLVNGEDVQAWTACWANSCLPAGCTCLDLDRDSMLTNYDLALFVSRLLVGTAGCR